MRHMVALLWDVAPTLALSLLLTGYSPP